MFEIIYTRQFKKDFKKITSKEEKELLRSVVELFIQHGTIPLHFNPHKLKGNHKGRMEAHLKPDLLIIWVVDYVEKVIVLTRIGNHSNLF